MRSKGTNPLHKVDLRGMPVGTRFVAACAKVVGFLPGLEGLLLVENSKLALCILGTDDDEAAQRDSVKLFGGTSSMNQACEFFGLRPVLCNRR